MRGLEGNELCLFLALGPANPNLRSRDFVGGVDADRTRNLLNASKIRHRQKVACLFPTGEGKHGTLVLSGNGCTSFRLQSGRSASPRAQIVP
jgi:hypothetical protein